MIELQLSLNPTNFKNFHKNLIKLNKEHNFYFYYILIKKMHKVEINILPIFPITI